MWPSRSTSTPHSTGVTAGLPPAGGQRQAVALERDQVLAGAGAAGVEAACLARAQATRSALVAAGWPLPARRRASSGGLPPRRRTSTRLDSTLGCRSLAA